MTQFRPARLSDQPALEAFLVGHIETSVFLLLNLRNHGPLGGTHPRAMRYFIREVGADITGCFGISTTGMIMPQLPGPTDWQAVASLLIGQHIEGVIGQADQCAALLAATHLTHAPTNLTSREKLYALDLCDLIVPDHPGHIVPLDITMRDVAVPWRAAYQTEALGTPQDQAYPRAMDEIDAYIIAGSHQMLIQNGACVAMTGFNAQLPELVQIGGVFTPPEQRSQGHARRAVALHLQQAAAQGVPRSVLFAANTAAEKAYESIGFKHIGHFSITLFTNPEVLT